MSWVVIVVTICKNIVSQNLTMTELWNLQTKNGSWDSFRGGYKHMDKLNREFHQIDFMDFIVVPLNIAGVCVNIRKNARYLRTCLICFALIAVFRRSTLDKKQSALLFIKSNKLIRRPQSAPLAQQVSVRSHLDNYNGKKIVSKHDSLRQWRGLWEYHLLLLGEKR